MFVSVEFDFERAAERFNCSYQNHGTARAIFLLDLKPKFRCELPYFIQIVRSSSVGSREFFPIEVTPAAWRKGP